MPKDYGSLLRKAYQKETQGGKRWATGRAEIGELGKVRIRWPEQRKWEQPKLDQLPNMDRLTPMEKWLYRKLPGFSESSVGKVMAKIGEGWAGKLLSKIDVLAEGAERVTGLAWQWNEAKRTNTLDDFNNNLKEAWYAGSLTADVANLPTFKRDNLGKITGYQLPTDLPGVSGLVSARKRLSQLVASGIPMSEALAQAKSEYYDSQGALALRSQLYDTYFHVIADPLNYILPALKPIESAHAARHAINAMRWSDEYINSTRAALKIAEGAQDAAEIARLSGILKAAEAPIKLGGFRPLAKLLTRTERFTMALTGGDTFKPGALAKKWWNPFALTPSAHAQEYLTMVTDNVGTRIFAASDDPYKIAEDINRAAMGALGPEYGHAFMTMEGRTVQGVLGGFNVDMQDLITAYHLTAPDRITLYKLANELGQNPNAILKIIQDGDIGALATRTGMTTDALKEIGENLSKVPHSPELFKVTAMMKLQDRAAQQGVIQFGVKSKGFIEKASQALKSAETLAFLRLNPAYLLKNLANNEVTMIGRGLMGSVNIGAIDNFFAKRVGFTPIRYAQGWGMAGVEIGGKEVRAGGAIAKAVRGDTTFLDKFSDWVNGIKFGKFDMGEMAGRVEVHARKRTFNAGYQEGWRMYWQPTHPADAIPAAIRQEVGDKMLNDLARAAKSAWNEDEVLSFAKGNLNTNIQSILDNASTRAGFDVRKALGDELVNDLDSGLREAIENGTTRDFFTNLRATVSKNLDEMSKDAVNFYSKRAQAYITAEGPNGFMRLFASTQDEFWGAHSAHAMEMQTKVSQIIGIVDPELRGTMWDNLLGKENKFFGHAWDRYEGTVRGMVAGAKEAGLEIPDEILDSFTSWKGGWKDFFNKRSSLYRKVKEGKGGISFEQVQAQLDDMYRQMVDTEAILTRKIDESVASLLPDPNMREPFLAWRARVADLRKADKAEEIAFRESIAGLPVTQKDIAFREHWSARMQRWADIKGEEFSGVNMMSGDPAAQAKYQELAGIRAQQQAQETAAAAERIETLRGTARQEYWSLSAKLPDTPEIKHWRSLDYAVVEYGGYKRMDASSNSSGSKNDVDRAVYISSCKP